MIQDVIAGYRDEYKGGDVSAHSLLPRRKTRIQIRRASRLFA